MRAIRICILMTTLLLSYEVRSIEGYRVVESVGYGETTLKAKSDAMNSALMAVSNQFIVAERLIIDDEILTDRVASTLRSFVNMVFDEEISESDGLIKYSARFKISEQDVGNYLGIIGNKESTLDGSSLFANALAKDAAVENNTIVLRSLFRDFPNSTFLIKATNTSLDDDYLKITAEQTIDPAFVTRLKKHFNDISYVTCRVPEKTNFGINHMRRLLDITTYPLTTTEEITEAVKYCKFKNNQFDSTLSYTRVFFLDEHGADAILLPYASLDDAFDYGEFAHSLHYIHAQFVANCSPDYYIPYNFSSNYWDGLFKRYLWMKDLPVLSDSASNIHQELTPMYSPGVVKNSLNLGLNLLFKDENGNSTINKITNGKYMALAYGMVQSSGTRKTLKFYSAKRPHGGTKQNLLIVDTIPKKVHIKVERGLVDLASTTDIQFEPTLGYNKFPYSLESEVLYRDVFEPSFKANPHKNVLTKADCGRGEFNYSNLFMN